MGQLAAWVHVADEAGGFHVFGPDDVVPEWAAAKITNPKAWASAPVGVGVPMAAAVVTPAAAKLLVDQGPQMPPKAGQGSGLAEWVTYARAVGIEVSEDATRGDVITLVEVFEDGQK